MARETAFLEAEGTTYTATFEMKKIDVSSEAEVNDLSDDIGFW